ncbi:ABC transporter permease [uncultured Gilliamella sp.]|jgi:amine acid ABC transporter, permease protein, 3-TM region, His/Glu/Gln/Arg/opine family|uniref:ABC transporter permease n=1 Tax=uncultured Gilliamella sp. TaxID=1193505 RepID=UPI0025F1BB1E|nr:histidine ABC transporter permease HisQ [uncultured Gilliamella sp.]
MQGYIPLIYQGAIITISLAIASLMLAIVLGIFCAIGKLSRFKVISLLCQAYTSFIRGVPDLVLMLLIFYGLQLLLNSITDFFSIGFIEINPLVAGIITLGFIYGAYFTETFRGAYLAVPKTTLEAAFALGLSKGQVFRYVMFPLMMRFALPGITNNWLVVLKATALVSLLGLSDLVRATKIVGEATYSPLLLALIAGAFYLFFTSISNIVLWWLEKHYSIGITKVKL